MSPEELEEIRYDPANAAIWLPKVVAAHKAKAAQIEALKEKLHHERVAYLRAVNSYHKKDGLEYVAREQLKAEMPEVEW
ncbi:MAG TPA: hypothetical protein PKX20_09135 [Methanothrix soehngenii]|nr:hypothetical protein [Methanothrix soehngenii]